MSQIKLKHSGGNSSIIAAPSSNPASDVTFRLPNADGSAGQFMKTDGSGNLAFAAISGGLAMADQWRYTAEFTQSNTSNYLATTNSWERPDSKLGINSNPLGTGMTQSGGIFTFPSTGYYFIFFHGLAKVDNDSCETSVFIRATENNSSYDNVARSLFTIANQCTPNYAANSISYLARVTDISNYKIQFRVSNSGISVTWMGETSENRIAATFLKLGDI
tara:strand:+ start:142 stop:798 length:657 start_codon:yes stop_codon:yes gene_type:complete